MTDRPFDPKIDNPCFGCEYRKPDERGYINICLLDESKPCIKEESNL